MKPGLAWVLVLAATPAWASHPLISEDTGVLGKGGWELEIHGESARDRRDGVVEKRSDIAVKLGYGATDRLDLEVELPYERQVTDGAVTQGRTDAILGLKWRFHERDGFSLVLKPDLMLPTGDEQRGLGAGRTRWAAALAAAYETGPVELLANIAYLRNRNTVSERESVWRVSGAVLYSLTEKLRLLVDYDHHTLPDPNDGSHGRELVAGAIYAFSDRVELGLGLKKGLNDAADDRSVRAGIKLRW